MARRDPGHGSGARGDVADLVVAASVTVADLGAAADDQHLAVRQRWSELRCDARAPCRASGRRQSCRVAGVVHDGRAGRLAGVVRRRPTISTRPSPSSVAVWYERFDDSEPAGDQVRVRGSRRAGRWNCRRRPRSPCRREAASRVRRGLARHVAGRDEGSRRRVVELGAGGGRPGGIQAARDQHPPGERRR